MTRHVKVPSDRLADRFPEPGMWAPECYQGPGGCYGIRQSEADLFQVYRIAATEEAGHPVSEPFLTPRAADWFAKQLAEGRPHDRK